MFNFCKADYDGITSFLLDSDFSILYDSSDIEYVWFLFKSFIYQAMSLYIPKVLVKRHQNPKWFDSDIRHHLKCLRTLKRKHRSKPSVHRQSKIHSMESILQSKLVLAKTSFENNLIESHQRTKSPAVFSYIRSVSCQNTIPSTVNLDDSFAVTDVD